MNYIVTEYWNSIQYKKQNGFRNKNQVQISRLSTKYVEEKFSMKISELKRRIERFTDIKLLILIIFFGIPLLWYCIAESQQEAYRLKISLTQNTWIAPPIVPPDHDLALPIWLHEKTCRNGELHDNRPSGVFRHPKLTPAPPRPASHQRAADPRAGWCGSNCGSPSSRPFPACRHFSDRW